MTAERQATSQPRIDQAVSQLQSMILERYPTATFDVLPGDDPEGAYVWATVDVDNTDQVLDVVLDRLLDLQVEEGLPVHVIPIRTPERVQADVRARQLRNRPYPRRPLSSSERAISVGE